MRIERISMITGQHRAWDMDVTNEQFEQWANKGVMVQDAFPHLSADEREFLMTGITPDEWEKYIEQPARENDPDYIEHDDLEEDDGL